jgi:DNA-binding GntR family transcriptional regulator
MRILDYNRTVYGRLKEMLLSGTFGPGCQLRPGDIADRLRVSATPVREALIRLCAEHLLVSAPNRGFFTKTLNLAELQELFGLSCLILRHQLATYGAGDSRGAVALAATNAADPAALVHAEEAMHAQLAGCSKLARATIRNLDDRTHFIRHLAFECSDHAEHIGRAAAELARALEVGNRMAASHALDAMYQRHAARLPVLVQEGLSRFHASAHETQALRGESIAQTG